MKNLRAFLILFSFYVSYSQSNSVVGSENENNKIDIFEEESKPSVDSELSLYFEKKLSKELIADAGLTQKRKRLILTFSFDENDKLIASTNAKSKRLNNEIIKAFKKYPK